ncbi:MAG: DUF6390 family protein [Acidimicrobiia bacterium]|nr:DUF6390 family protein [Acidimicrobiia bacterium]
MTVAGALRFARFAVPPNERGYCGPERTSELAAYRAEELAVDPGLPELAAGFDGAWPYLELLAGAAGSDDPLDDRVVEAYWIGNDLCRRVTSNDLGWHLVDRFGPRAGRDVARLTAGVGHGAVPHHAFHVFNVYPWVGLLREGRGGDEPLRIIRHCHIGWGAVIDRVGDELVIDGPTVTWDGGALAIGGTERRAVRLDPRLASLRAAIREGSVVAVHWGEVVDVLDPRQQWWLASTTASQIDIANKAGARTIG